MTRPATGRHHDAGTLTEFTHVHSQDHPLLRRPAGDRIGGHRHGPGVEARPVAHLVGAAADRRAASQQRPHHRRASTPRRSGRSLARCRRPSSTSGPSPRPVPRSSPSSSAARTSCGGSSRTRSSRGRARARGRAQGARPNRRQRPAPQSQGAGTGFIIDAAEGLILTNNHVVENANKIEVAFFGDESDVEFEAKIVGRDPLTDSALIQLLKKPARRCSRSSSATRIRCSRATSWWRSATRSTSTTP